MIGAASAALVTSVFPLQLQSTGELWPAVRIAAETVLSPTGLAFVLAGALLGVTMGALPGLGGPVALALLIPVTHGLDANVSVLLLVATLGGVAFGGSVTAILFNTPGDAPNAATVLDGYPMARAGRAAEALTASAVASGAGAVVGLCLLLVTVPFVREFALLFHSVDVFWLAVVGLVTVAVVSRGGVVVNLVAGGVGLLLAFHGRNPVTGTARFTWGSTYLRDGIGLVPLLIGLFAVAEMLRLAADGSPTVRADEGSPDTESGAEAVGDGAPTGAGRDAAGEGERGVSGDRDATRGDERGVASDGGGRRAGLRAVVENRGLFGRSAAVGWLVGVVPGAGGTVATFVAYLSAQASAARPAVFGTGTVKGVVASEAANDAKDGGSMVPTLGLGIPGSASTAVLLGALVVNGVVPGPSLFRENLQLVFVVVFGLLGANLVTSAAGAAAARQLARLTRVPTHTLVPVVLCVALTGAFVERSSLGDVAVAAAFGVVGLGMFRFGLSRVPVVIAFVLGPLAEENFHRALQVSRGDYLVFLERPVSLVLVAVALAVLALPFMRPRLTDDDRS